MKVNFGVMMLLLSASNEAEGVRVNSISNNKAEAKYDHWTEERFDNSNATTWVGSSPMAAYGRVDLDNYVQL